jgi:hypothetical protein
VMLLVQCGLKVPKPSKNVQLKQMSLVTSLII